MRERRQTMQPACWSVCQAKTAESHRSVIAHLSQCNKFVSVLGAGAKILMGNGTPSNRRLSPRSPPRCWWS